jgi:hypothetical protein
MQVFFFGMGYSSLAAARAIHAMDAAIPIAGTTRSEETIEAFADSPYRLHVFNGAQRSETLAADLRQSTHAILSIPPDEHGDPAYMLHRADLDAASNLQWLCYYSTVGVYGDFNGEWIDESAVLHPISAACSALPPRSCGGSTQWLADCRCSFFGFPASMVRAARRSTNCAMERRGGS